MVFPFTQFHDNDVEDDNDDDGDGDGDDGIPYEHFDDKQRSINLAA